MIKFKKSQPASTLVLVLITAFASPFAYSLGAENSNNTGFAQDEAFGIELTFDYPDPVATSEQFMFTVTIKKPASYQAAGSLRCKFLGGLSPIETHLNEAEYSLENKTATIRWESLSNSNIISFSIPAISSVVPNGVYPVNISLEDKYGFKITTSVGVFVKNKSENLLPFIRPGEENSPYSIHLQYPNEISYQEKYPLKIILEKGKYTGSLELFVTLPPGSKIDIVGIDDYQYNSDEGRLFIKMASLPAGPEFVINCTVMNTHNTTSVYPVMASVKLDNISDLVFAHTIFVGVENTVDVETDFDNALIEEDENPALLADYTDNADKYAGLDSLLNEWKASTGAKVTSSEKQMSEEIFPDFKADGKTFFAVQIVASEVKLSNIQSRLNTAHVDDPVRMDYDGSIYRYYIGQYQSHTEARKLADHLAPKGFEGAFVVKFVNGEKTESYY